MKEIYRVLKVGGYVVVVDSLNNLIFRFNRHINNLRDLRSQSTFKRMPDINLIN
jgi:ubiquinone/menaquinone biosynthesis C-methylase UbiE